MKLTSLIAIFVIFSFATLLLVQCSSNKEELHEQLKAEVESVNNMCPMIISETLFLDSCVLLPNNDMQYYYTYGDSIAFDTIAFEKEIVAPAKGMTKNEPGMATVRDNKITNEYIYRDTVGNILYSFKITPQDY